ncbi:uncharacterized protein TRIADDRAFT_53665 [Trichoplax adhaerens]|uniref:RNA helicase n=1 Tax=Trichoplax adhaerens TaxID=10228 RepID=B3RPU4_TRIAD|nr:hypothetical protein TRIADDRAFT_53665 [Trichoplax adhaerens]EDV27700.1 hypothetical protein TRIADDRAFT_53665 [Trichoplax adhaerens]|eukprot:XP_002109534.1 hypothetical protein TRIADDRAFT_53665 [Trichoplax adhaerens]
MAQFDYCNTQCCINLLSNSVYMTCPFSILYCTTTIAPALTFAAPFLEQLTVNASKERTMKQNLPIYKCLKQILQIIDNSNPVVIVGSTGSGKTTQLPQYLLENGYGRHGVIGVSQPRRVAAISVATRVAEEMKCDLGSTVGYQVRFDNCTSDETKIKYMTDGCLLREFLDDRYLSRYSVVILDEAHERSLDTDILFGLSKALFLRTDETDEESTPSKRSNPLKVIIMSATLNYQQFSEFFNNCPVFNIPGQIYPVEEIYCNYITVKNVDNPGYISKAVDTVMDIHMTCPSGDILVFLTGQAEIEKVCDMLYAKAENVNYQYDVQDERVKAMLILPLYGSMQTDLQQRVFDECETWIRKIIVATNIAGTSLTIDGIRDVYEKVMKKDTIPEIQRANLSKVVLSLKCMNINNVLHFHYLDPPSERLLLRALWQLYVIGAINKEGYVTESGRKIIQFPVTPNLAKALVESWKYNCCDYLLPIAAMLSVENVFVKPGREDRMEEANNAHTTLADLTGGKNDFATLLSVYSSYHDSTSPSRWCKDNYIHMRALKTATSIHKQLRRILTTIMQTEENQPNLSSQGKSNERLRRCLCAGYFCNIARKCEVGRSFRTMDGHGTVISIHPSSALHGKEDMLDWIIFHEIVCTSRVYVRIVCPVKHEWVKDWLPRLHDVDPYALSQCLTMANNSQSVTVTDNTNSTQNDSSDFLHEEIKKLQRRNTGESVMEARERF